MGNRIRIPFVERLSDHTHTHDMHGVLNIIHLAAKTHHYISIYTRYRFHRASNLCEIKSTARHPVMYKTEYSFGARSVKSYLLTPHGAPTAAMGLDRPFVRDSGRRRQVDGIVLI